MDTFLELSSQIAVGGITAVNRDELDKRIDIGQFILSEKAAAELSDLTKNLAKARDTADWIDFTIGSHEAIGSTLKRMRAIAKADLKGH